MTARDIPGLPERPWTIEYSDSECGIIDGAGNFVAGLLPPETAAALVALAAAYDEQEAQIAKADALAEAVEAYQDHLYARVSRKGTARNAETAMFAALANYRSQSHD